MYCMYCMYCTGSLHRMQPRDPFVTSPYYSTLLSHHCSLYLHICMYSVRTAYTLPKGVSETPLRLIPFQHI